MEFATRRLLKGMWAVGSGQQAAGVKGRSSGPYEAPAGAEVIGRKQVRFNHIG